jgi:hypothetical protein
MNLEKSNKFKRKEEYSTHNLRRRRKIQVIIQKMEVIMKKKKRKI